MMGKKLNVLVLGVGGNVSQGILKALSLSSVPCRVIGACVSSLALGLYTVDKAYVSPMADSAQFIDWVIEICNKENIQAIFSGVEPVLYALAQSAERIEEQTSAICVVSNSNQLKIGGDKLLTCQWLEQKGLNFPRYAVAEDGNALCKLLDECGYPLIAKPRFGRGGKGLIDVRKYSDLQYVSTLQDYIVQEYLGDEKSEYTVGCFSDRQGDVRGTIAMRRDLLEGTTYRAEVVNLPELRSESEKIATNLRPFGPCNMQFRIPEGRPVCFEINIRFSGTTPMRARFGFNDVEATLRHYILKENIENLPLVTEGVALRYWNEMYIDPKAARTLHQMNQLEPQKYKLLFEDYGF